MAAFTIPTIFTAIDRFSTPVSGMQRALDKVSQKALQVSKATAIAGAAILAPLAIAAKSAVDFQDKMADVSKTTGLQGAALDDFGASLLRMSKGTRTGIDDLLKIAEIGGQFGVPADQLEAFTMAANKFNVALGSDFSGGVEEAISKVSSLKVGFKELRDTPIAEAITRAGSAINALGAMGAATSSNITDFANRISALPDAMKPTATATLALGTLFEEAALKSEVASSGFSQLLMTGAKQLPAFAKQMNITTKAAQELLAADPAEFAKKFAATFKGMSAEQLANKLHDLKLNSNEVAKVVGVLSTGTARLTELQDAANKAFQEGTSLSMEYATKNDTVAAKIAKAENNFKALSIMIGNRLLPIIGKFLDKVLPVIEVFSSWIDKNPELTQTILIVAGAIGGLLMAVSGVSAVFGIAVKAVAMFNAVFVATPIGWVVLGIAALIAIIILVAKYTTGWGKQWDETMKWMGSIFETYKQGIILGWELMKDHFVSMVDTLVTTWYWFQNKIGALSDEQYNKNISQIAAEKEARINSIRETAAALEKAGSAALSGPGFHIRSNAGERATDDAMKNGTAIPAVSPQFNNVAAVFKQMSAQKQQAEITIKDQTGKAAVTGNSGGAPPKITSTVGVFGQ